MLFSECDVLPAPQRLRPHDADPPPWAPLEEKKKEKNACGAWCGLDAQKRPSEVLQVGQVGAKGAQKGPFGRPGDHFGEENSR